MYVPFKCDRVVCDGSGSVSRCDRDGWLGMDARLSWGSDGYNMRFSIWM